MTRKTSAVTLALLLAFILSVPSLVLAQSSTSGDITGVVTDPTGAVVSGARVTAVNIDKGRTITTNTNSSGYFRFALLSPGNYAITVTSSGFQETTRKVKLAVGQAPAVDFKLAIASASGVVEVTAEAGGIQTNNGNISTSFNQSQIENTPNPGNDLTCYVQTAPGVIMNTLSGYGNFSSFGLPATSNVFTINGMTDNDPMANINYSGATNLMLGANDISEVTVVNNGYLGEYGGLAGSNVNYITKSGTNAWHGNAEYFYNNDTLNANSWRNNFTNTAKTFSLAQQYAGSIGGPIKKDKAYIFFNAEGLYLDLPPTGSNVTVPTPEIQSAILNNLANQTEKDFYRDHIFPLYNAAGAAHSANLVPAPANGAGPGCPDPVSLSGAAATFVNNGGACANQFTSTTSSRQHENMEMGRFDYNIGPIDHAYLHIRRDVGYQASITDPISPLFNLVSPQPEYDGQLSETHTFGNNSVNQFNLSGMYFGMVFNVPNVNAAKTAMPFTLNFAGDTFTQLGGYEYAAQGRNGTHYQIADDFSHIWRNHNLKFGVNFVRDDLTDFGPLSLSQAGYSAGEDLSSFFDGVNYFYLQNFVSNGRTSAPIASYGLGIYAQDEWRARQNLKLTFTLRAEHNSNPVCQIGCFSRFASSFNQVDPTLPDSQSLVSNQSQALTKFDSINWQPRFGFAYTPFGASSDLVIRGGFGIFIDKLPLTITDYMLANAPFENGYQLAGVSLATSPALAAAQNAIFQSGFASGQSANPTSPNYNPNFPALTLFVPAASLHSPQYQEWNLEVQKGLGRYDTLSLNYVGNHGIHEPYVNWGVNAYDPNGFGGLFVSSMAPNPNFSTVAQVNTDAVSNYNGITISLRHQYRGLQLQFNYTWSHALDEISNGGILPFSGGVLGLADNSSVLTPQDPNNLRLYNYGNADYDVRHNLSASWVWETPKLQNKVLNVIASWTTAGTVFWHSGTPYTVVDTLLESTLSGQNDGNAVFANQLVPGVQSCGAGSALAPCPVMTGGFASVSPSGSTAPGLSWGNQRRNQLYGPGYFNMSMSFMKKFSIPHWESGKLAAGAQFFNIFNHPNFDQPVNDVRSNSYGQILRGINTPTTIYGASSGFDLSSREIQLRATLTF